MKKFAFGALALSICSFSSWTLAQSKPLQHPLADLTSEEYWTVHDVLYQSGHTTENTNVSMLVLHEPDKNAVLAWKPGDPITREADVILEDSNKTIEARVDIGGKKLELWKVIPGVQAPFTQAEIHGMDGIIKKDPRVQEALKKRGLTDMSTIHCSAGPLALRVFPEQEKIRLGYGGCTDSNGQYHSWGRNIEGLYFTMDITAKKVLEVFDRGVLPNVTYVGDFEESGDKALEGTKPILISQPQGASYKIDDVGEIAWQNWRFRFRLDSRIGPVVNLVRFKDGDRLRSVLYEGSFSEMFVPYMDTAEGWNSRSFLDAGEFMRDGFLRAIDTDDCPANAQFFPGLAPNDRGTPILRTKLACLFERTTGNPAWRHLENGVMSGRPSRELVLRTGAEIGNYDYMMDWIFQQDGTIRVALGSTGIIEAKGVKETMVDEHAGMSDPQYGTLVAPNTVAVNHDHYFSFRLDLDVDGPNNNFMVDRLVPQTIKARTRTSIWAVQSSQAKSESDGILDLDPRKPAMWHFVSSTQKDPQGYFTGYEIMPEGTAVSFLSPDDPAERVGGFAQHQLWVTPYNPDERYAAGVYLTSSKGGEGLPKWTRANRSLQNTDLVAWYTLGFHHVPRVEDWPVMPTLWHEFLIRPVNFFGENPVINLPHQP